jgi:hypothetical protein
VASNAIDIVTARQARGDTRVASVDRRSDVREIDRLVPSGLIEQWAMHLRRERSRAVDSLWLIDNGFSLHDGRDGVPTADATARHRGELQATVAEVSQLLAQYDALNLRRPAEDLA